MEQGKFVCGEMSSWYEHGALTPKHFLDLMGAAHEEAGSRDKPGGPWGYWVEFGRIQPANVLLELQGGICSHRWLHTHVSASQAFLCNGMHQGGTLNPPEPLFFTAATHSGVNGFNVASSFQGYGY